MASDPAVGRLSISGCWLFQGSHEDRVLSVGKPARTSGTQPDSVMGRSILINPLDLRMLAIKGNFGVGSLILF